MKHLDSQMRMYATSEACCCEELRHIDCEMYVVKDQKHTDADVYVYPKCLSLCGAT